MTEVLLIFCVCICIYAGMFVNTVLENKKKRDNVNYIKIFPPREAEIKKEQETLSNNRGKIDYPDQEFEEICKIILKEETNERQIVKFIHDYFPHESDPDKQLLLKCLRINNPERYNGVISLLQCDSSEFEGFNSENIDVNIPQNIHTENNGQCPGIPAAFFFSAIQIASPEQEGVDIYSILNNINEIYESLSQEEQDRVTMQSQSIKKKSKRIAGHDFIAEAIRQGNTTGEAFMEIFAASYNTPDE